MFNIFKKRIILVVIIMDNEQMYFKSWEAYKIHIIHKITYQLNDK
jgi:hypothetical protein